MEDIVLLGGGGHAHSVADSIESCGNYRIVGYTDFVREDSYLTYLGTDEQLASLYNKGIHNAVICVGFLGKSMVRDKLYNMVKKIGYDLPAIIDPSAHISSRCNIGEGTFIGKGVCVNTGTRIGKMCIINTSSVIEHDNCISDYSHIAVGSVLCGNVNIGDHVFIGANSTIIQGITIEPRAIVGAGSTVLHKVLRETTVYGII